MRNLIAGGDALANRIGLIALTNIARGVDFSSREVQRDLKSLVLHMTQIKPRKFSNANIRDGLCLLGS